MCAVKWCLVLALISAGFAQQTSRSSPGNSSAQARNVNSPSAKLVLNGCINTGNNRYTMMQESTGTTFDLRGRDADLKQAQGKLVEVKGYELPPVGGVGLNDVPRLEVKSLRVISAKCPIQTELRRRTVLSRQGEHRTQNSVATPEYGAPGAVNQTPPTVGNNPTNWGNGAHGAPSPGTGNPPAQPSPSQSQPPQ